MQKLIIYVKKKIAAFSSKCNKKKQNEHIYINNNQSNRDNWVNEKLLAIPDGFSILDAGAGEKRYEKYCSHLHYKSQDFCQYDGIGNKSGLQNSNWNQKSIDIISDIVKIPEPDESYDVVLCTEVLEHIPKPIEALEELHRLLKPKGLLILTAPFCSITHMAPFHYYSGFNKYFYENLLNEIGFEILELSTNGNFFDYLGQEMMRFSEIAEKYIGPVQITEDEIKSISIIKDLLIRCSELESGSDDLLCFGYHILAKRQN